jgi:CBS domain-containing protein
VSTSDFLRRPAGNDAGTVADIMERKPLTVGPTAKLDEIVELLANGRFHSLPVVQDGRLVGIVTTTDLLRRLHESLVRTEA